MAACGILLPCDGRAGDAADPAADGRGILLPRAGRAGEEAEGEAAEGEAAEGEAAFRPLERA